MANALKKWRADRAKKKRDKNRQMTFAAHPFLKDIKPKERYVFHSDYYQVDDYFATILTFVHNTAARDNFGPFWGINFIPGAGLEQGVTTMNFQQVKRMTNAWIDDHQTRAEGYAEINEVEQDRGGSNSSRGRASRKAVDLEIIAAELNEGASYLNVHDRLLVKAPTLEMLDDAVAKIERLYVDRFATLTPAPYVGDQRHELAMMLARNDKKRGKGNYYTSTEFAGCYNLVTHGLEDAAGEYVGYMVGDVNNSAIIFDVDNYRHHVVIASEQVNMRRNRAHIPDMWGAKLAQSALMNGGRVIHILMGECDMSQLGPEFKSFTRTLDMNSGDVNMFEMFGKPEDELAIFASQMQKLVLMAEQAYETTEHDRSVIRGSLEEVATQFYIDQRMWHENAGENRERLRVVGIPHTDVPRLQIFVTYLDQAYKALDAAQNSRDAEKLHAMSVLSMTFRNLLSNNGDLFNQYTNPIIDDVVGARRIIYDFGDLMRRGRGVAMAQLVNVIDYAVSQMGQNDVVIIHSAENIDAGVRAYIEDQFSKLWLRGGRVAYLYNTVEAMIRDVDFNHFDKADYTILGNMSDNVAMDYQKTLGQSIPETLQKLVTNKSDAILYVRRGFDNVVFRQDLRLDPYNTSHRGV